MCRIYEVKVIFQYKANFKDLFKLDYTDTASRKTFALYSYHETNLPVTADISTESSLIPANTTTDTVRSEQTSWHRLLLLIIYYILKYEWKNKNCFDNHLRQHFSSTLVANFCLKWRVDKITTRSIHMFTNNEVTVTYCNLFWPTQSDIPSWRSPPSCLAVTEHELPHEAILRQLLIWHSVDLLQGEGIVRGEEEEEVGTYCFKLTVAYVVEYILCFL